jgi:hypothetical protein
MYAASRRRFLQLSSPGIASAYEADADHTIVRALTSRHNHYLTKCGKHAYYGPPKDKP